MPSAVVSTAASGTTALVAAPGVGRRIRIMGWFLAAAGAVTVKFQSAANDLTGAMSLATGQAFAYGPTYDGTGLDCNANEALNIVLGTGVQVSGFVSYQVYG